MSWGCWGDQRPQILLAGMRQVAAAGQSVAAPSGVKRRASPDLTIPLCVPKRDEHMATQTVDTDAHRSSRHNS